jgi:hypothetical protein
MEREKDNLKCEKRGILVLVRNKEDEEKEF